MLNDFETGGDVETDGTIAPDGVDPARRDALRAIAKYSGAVGAAATLTVLSAQDAVAQQAHSGNDTTGTGPTDPDPDPDPDPDDDNKRTRKETGDGRSQEWREWHEQRREARRARRQQRLQQMNNRFDGGGSSGGGDFNTF